MKWYVNRQHYWGVDEDDAYMVEIAQGGSDYSNPDELVNRYPGEGQEYYDPFEAAQAAVAIADAWQHDEPDKTINIAYGYTMGHTMPFSPMTEEQVLEWGRKKRDSLPRCDRCGGFFDDPDKFWYLYDDQDAGRFCSEICCDWAYASLQEEEEA